MMGMEHCPGCVCGQDRFVARRLDIWLTAQQALAKSVWPDESPAVDAIDAQRLADFLSGDNAPLLIDSDDDDDDPDADDSDAAPDAEEEEPEAEE